MPHTPNTMVELHFDGACLGNPGPGGWACIVRQDGNEALLTGAQAQTTNNRMELSAAIAGLSEAPDGAHVSMHGDSQYVLKGIDEWIDGWKRRGWKRAGNKRVENEDLWRIIDGHRQRLVINTTWVRGHAGHEENERCDKAARAAAQEIAQDG
ncbi:MAG: ribonuclease HI [Phycisphaerales bacterium]|nr:ribonuclease HI [Phycisphaerales bacterium]